MEKNTTQRPNLLIVEARFYDDIADELLDGARAQLKENNAHFDTITVSGALEVPAAMAFAEKSLCHYDGYIALGCVIRGETYHFNIVANESCRALMNLTTKKRMAIGNGILTVENKNQAHERAQRQQKNKGGEAAAVALEMIALKQKFGV